ncbi:hypothetical protein ACFQZX_05955 [Mucilaginibacter litoreus]|uniref:Uncharacterized protein n=1 Tax=Mucilaginibacter litoreus TaxID=1048221 RepID=A0ABW3AQJ9_9SPHI
MSFHNRLRFVSCFLYLISLTQNAFCTELDCIKSFWCLIGGCFSFLLGGAAITWFANPLIFLSWYYLNKNIKASLYISFAASVMCLSFLLFFKRVMINEAGQYSIIIFNGFGYWLWVTSALTMVIGILFTHISVRSQ